MPSTSKAGKGGRINRLIFESSPSYTPRHLASGLKSLFLVGVQETCTGKKQPCQGEPSEPMGQYPGIRVGPRWY